MIQDEDDPQALSAARPPQRRGGELYNAFAEDSDQELLDEEGEDDEDELYKDHPDGHWGGGGGGGDHKI